MEQFLAHLVGDYLLQTEQMALRKSKSWFWALLHAAVYTLPFLLLTRSVPALLIILGTHAVIDRFALAPAFCRERGLVTWFGKDRPELDTRTGFSKETPPWLSFWLGVITDNTFHLTINYFALRYCA